MNDQLDGTKLVLAHIFLHHTADKKYIDAQLLQELKKIAKEMDSPVYYEAVSSLYGNIDNWPEYSLNIDAAIDLIEKRQLDIRDKVHQSHYYYNAACSHSQAGNYEIAKARLQQAFSLDRSLSQWSLKDPDLKGLRNYMGIDLFKSKFDL